MGNESHLTNDNTHVEIRRIPGQLPSLWDRRVIYISNLLSLFFGNEDGTQMLRDMVGPVETYGGRLIPILDLVYHGPENNLLMLENEPDRDLMTYFEAELGLRLPEVDILTHPDYLALAEGRKGDDPERARVLERMETHPARWLDGYVSDNYLMKLADLLGKQTCYTELASKRGNNKMLLFRHLEQSNLPVFDTRIAASRSELPGCLAELRALGYQYAAVKSQIGASGIGLVKVPVDRDPDVPEYLFYEGDCLVQGWMDASAAGVTPVGSPSVQLFLNEETVSLYDFTEQILSHQSVHEGNIAPPDYLVQNKDAREEMLRQAEVSGAWLHEQGYRGTASVDFHIVERNGEQEIRVCEINARVTGATYPSVLARHFMPGGAWLMRNLRFRGSLATPQILKTLSDARLLFRPDDVEGVLPINVNADETGNVVKGQFLCLTATTGQAEALLERAHGVLPVQAEFDRD